MKHGSRLPPFKSLRAFQIAGKHLSFKMAADELFLTASAISHQVRNLESFLGVELFQRKTRALEFTDAGQKYFTYLDEMFCRLEAETHQLASEYNRKILRLCVPPFFASSLLLPRLASLQLIMPDVDIQVTSQPSLMNVHPADADLSILLGEDEWPYLETTTLFNRHILTACSPALKQSLKLKKFTDLNNTTLLAHENRPYSWRYWAESLGIEQPKAGKIFRFDSMSAVVQGAVQGLGVAIVSWPLSQPLFDSGDLVPAFGENITTSEKFYIAHRPEETDRKEVALLKKWIIEAFNQQNINALYYNMHEKN
jgi:LysR family glycine cleavage system transcriptional activator